MNRHAGATSGSATDLVGRAVLISEVTAALDDTAGFGAMIVGEAGVGKSALARAVVQQLQWSAPVLRMTGGASLRHVPFGALAPYLHTLSLADAESPVAVLRALMKHLPAKASGRAQHPPLIVIDDAHELDHDSGALIAQLISARRVKLLVVLRDPTTTPQDILTLTTDGLLRRFDLPPLEPDAVRTLCSQVLGGPVLTGTLHYLARVTGGNPQLLLTLIGRGKIEGHLQQLHGVWRLTTDQPMVHPHLADLVLAQLTARSAEELEILDLIALAEPVALHAVSRCVDAGALERLRVARLVVIGAGPDQPVSLGHPLHGEVLRSRVPIARSTQIRGRVLGALPPEPQSTEGFLRSVSWGLDVGAPMDDGSLLRAAALANGMRDTHLALRAARAVSAPGLHGRVLTEIARVEARRGNLAHAHELVDEAMRHCADLDVAKDATLLTLELGLESGVPYASLRDAVRRWRSAITEAEAREGAPVTAAEVSAAQLGCRVLDCYLLIHEGHISGVEGDLRAIIADPRGTAETRVGALVLLGELLGSMGRPAEGVQCTREALEIIDADGALLLRHREFAVARHVVLLSATGEAALAKTVVDGYSRAQPRSTVYFAGWGDVVDGTSALQAGRNREARDRFLLALQALKESDIAHLTILLLAMAAYASALAGDAPQAGALIEEFERSAERGSSSTRLGGRIFVTATSALLVDDPGPRADLITLAETAEKDLLGKWAGTALRLSLLLGDKDAIDPLVRVLQGHQGAGARTLLDFATAARARDADAMVAAATEAGEHGDQALEFVGLSLARRLLSEQSSSRQARAIQRRLVMLGEQREGPLPAPLIGASPVAIVPRLTPTEQRIVALVRKGYTNRQIADTNKVSVRTVEGHLYRIFAKLGVGRREDLREA
ncbi:helix-turn-helix transcriptional regulator [Arthrobacter sp. MDT2-16]